MWDGVDKIQRTILAHINAISTLKTVNQDKGNFVHELLYWENKARRTHSDKAVVGPAEALSSTIVIATPGIIVAFVLVNGLLY